MPHLDGEPYRPFNLLLADRASAFVVHGRQPPQVAELPPGLHVLADGDVDDDASRRVARAATLGAALRDGAADTAISGLQAALADADPAVDSHDRLCRRFEAAGTVSAIVVAIPADGRRSASFLYAPGPPDRYPFEDLSESLRAGP